MSIIGKHAAFPLALAEECNEWNPGLTKRELFAAMAMQGYISSGSTGMPNCEDIGKLAAKTVDALIAELSKAAK